MIELICPTHRPQLQLGNQGQSVAHLQQAINARLDLLGIPTELVARLKIDGEFGSFTLQVVRYLQCLSFTAVDGIVGSETWTALCEGSSRMPILSHGSTGALVKTVQQVLQNLDFYHSAVDGIFEAFTQAAIKQYQTARQLPNNGIIRPSTWEKLSQDYSGHGPRCLIRIYGSVVVE
jgi:peptidoglycan hydrolase-like protein with peptidoglycan-binding domain